MLSKISSNIHFKKLHIQDTKENREGMRALITDTKTKGCALAVFMEIDSETRGKDIFLNLRKTGTAEEPSVSVEFKDDNENVLVCDAYKPNSYRGKPAEFALKFNKTKDAVFDRLKAGIDDFFNIYGE